jgi:hypothetical protein
MALSDAAQLVVSRYGEKVAAGQGRDFYGSVAAAIRAAAGELVAEKRLAAKDAEDAVRDATAFVARGGRA